MAVISAREKAFAESGGQVYGEYSPGDEDDAAIATAAYMAGTGAGSSHEWRPRRITDGQPSGQTKAARS
jgi:hypothetical protein